LGEFACVKTTEAAWSRADGARGARDTGIMGREIDPPRRRASPGCSAACHGRRARRPSAPRPSVALRNFSVRRLFSVIGWPPACGRQRGAPPGGWAGRRVPAAAGVGGCGAAAGGASVPQTQFSQSVKSPMPCVCQNQRRDDKTVLRGARDWMGAGRIGWAPRWLAQLDSWQLSPDNLGPQGSDDAPRKRNRSFPLPSQPRAADSRAGGT
jgi:hypothetical protein